MVDKRTSTQGELLVHLSLLRCFGAQTGVFLSILVEFQFLQKERQSDAAQCYFEVPFERLESMTFTKRKQRRFLQKLESLEVIDRRKRGRKELVRINFMALESMMINCVKHERVSPFTKMSNHN